MEVQALWLNALRIGAQRNSAWQSLFDSGLQAFRSKFWNEARVCLFDVIDCDHRRGTSDASLRPNQIFAVGGLPLCLLEDEPARAVVDAVEASLLTPKGLRSLGPQELDYRPRVRGRGRAARRKLSPGNRLAMAHRTIRRALVTRTRQLSIRDRGCPESISSAPLRTS